MTYNIVCKAEIQSMIFVRYTLIRCDAYEVFFIQYFLWFCFFRTIFELCYYRVPVARYI
jgi:hypothetical protein